MTERDYSSEQQQPEPPKPDLAVDDQSNVEVAKDAGVGSPLAYARATVVELGGMVAFSHSSETTLFRFAPLLGYFFVDNVELTLFPELQIINVEGETDYSVGGVLEPSYHLPLSDTLYAFAGIGVGLRWSEDPGLDLFLRPRVGLDIMVGRSGIFKPAGFIDVGVNDGLTSGGVEASFTVMW